MQERRDLPGGERVRRGERPVVANAAPGVRGERRTITR